MNLVGCCFLFSPPLLQMGHPMYPPASIMALSGGTYTVYPFHPAPHCLSFSYLPTVSPARPFNSLSSRTSFRAFMGSLLPFFKNLYCLISFFTPLLSVTAHIFPIPPASSFLLLRLKHFYPHQNAIRAFFSLFFLCSPDPALPSSSLIGYKSDERA